MTNFNDFCKWAGSQKRASDMLCVSEATVSRWAAKGCAPNLEAARSIETASHGLFKWADMLVPASEKQAA